MKQKMELLKAEALAWCVMDELRPYCQRIEIAGSIRRRKSEIGDIEIVAIPQFTKDLFGNVTEDHELNFPDWSYIGKAIKNGNKYKQIELEQGVNLDLFIVTPPAQWGIQFLIRTGPAEFSHRLVTSKRFGGLMPSNFRVEGGAIWSNNHVIETPEEQDVFRVIGLPFISPEYRK